MRLRAICFAEPRVYPGGVLVGIIEGPQYALSYEAGVLSVKKGDGPTRHYAVCPRDWWEESDVAPGPVEVLAMVSLPPEPTASPTLVMSPEQFASLPDSVTKYMEPPKPSKPGHRKGKQ